MSRVYEVDVNNLSSQNVELKEKLAKSRKDHIAINVELDRAQTLLNDKDLEIQRLREALEDLLYWSDNLNEGDWMCRDKSIKKAKEALKGSNDD